MRHGKKYSLSCLKVLLHIEPLESTFANAILGRPVYNAYRLVLNGPSMRKPTGKESREEQVASTELDEMVRC